MANQTEYGRNIPTNPSASEEANDRPWESVGRCYTQGVCPDDASLGEVLEDADGKRFVVNSQVNAVKDAWLKDHTLIVTFQGEARQLSRQVKEDLIRAYEDGWFVNKLFGHDAERERVNFEGANVVAYVARPERIATWLLRQRELSIKLKDSEEYKVTFKPWFPIQELKEMKLQEAEVKFWIMALRVPLDAYHYLRSEVQGDKQSEHFEGSVEKRSAMSSSSAAKNTENEEMVGNANLGAREDRRADTVRKSQVEKVQRRLVLVLCTMANDGVYFLALAQIDGTPMMSSVDLDHSHMPSEIVDFTKSLYGQHVAIRLIPKSTMVSLIVESGEKYYKLYFPLLDARLPLELVDSLTQAGVRWVHMSKLSDQFMEELESIKITPDISTVVLRNVNEKLQEEECLQSSFLARALTAD
ncbi:hypothetical protein CBR_g4203 [Chara braunii]|uniref:Uncharacterized protein n=1 Tax=Chara braunii TaxID=69332 RepID=A0A388KHG9_CHABU|nr:hypothetical protein CBR_g4203 [Chara braunii]|eukprot:GBG69510.1 hypothetical protein CBR_g4203 [Chara braunii]